MPKERVREAISVIMDELNGGNSHEIAVEIHDRVSREHRTLQESFWSTMLLAQIRYADNPSDMRNEQAVELAKLVKAIARMKNFDCGLRYL